MASQPHKELSSLSSGFDTRFAMFDIGGPGRPGGEDGGQVPHASPPTLLMCFRR
jgi:hypothetical protein